MAEFGNHSDHTQYINASDLKAVIGIHTMPEDGIITKLGSYFGKDSGAGDYVLAIFTSLGALVGYTSSYAIPESYDWHEQNLISPQAVSAGVYIIALWTTGTACYAYYTPSAEERVQVYSSPGIGGTFPTPAASITPAQAPGIGSLYAVYTPGGGGSAIVKIINE